MIGRSNGFLIIMGSMKDVLALFAERDLRHVFSEYDGWTISPISSAITNGGLYRISRGKWVGEEVAYVAVSFDRIVGNEAITALDIQPNGSRNPPAKKYLLTPQASNTACVPPHVRILLMTAFAFSEGNLVWLTKKKNARRFACEPAPVAA